MFSTCCGWRTHSPDEKWSDATKKRGTSEAPIPPRTNNQTAADIMNTNNLKTSSQEKFQTRTISSSSVNSLRSIQSFYSAKSGDDDGDYYSVCSDSSYSTRDKY